MKITKENIKASIEDIEDTIGKLYKDNIGKLTRETEEKVRDLLFRKHKLERELFRRNR